MPRFENCSRLAGVDGWFHFGDHALRPDSYVDLFIEEASQ